MLEVADELVGRAKILEFWKGAMSQFTFVVMTLNGGTLEQRGDGGIGRWYLTEYLRESGGWCFALRSHHVIDQGPFDLSGTHQPIPA